jgi:hypothetical protein
MLLLQLLLLLGSHFRIPKIARPKIKITWKK